MYIWVFIVCSLLNLEQCSFCHFWENLRWSQCLGLYFWLHHEVHGMGMFVHLAIQLHQYLLNLWCTPFLLGAPNCIGSSWYKVCYNNNERHGQHKKKTDNKSKALWFSYPFSTFSEAWYRLHRSTTFLAFWHAFKQYSLRFSSNSDKCALLRHIVIKLVGSFDRVSCINNCWYAPTHSSRPVLNLEVILENCKSPYSSQFLSIVALLLS